ncbi:hypothetical protein ACFLZV_07030 [Candidatus Margulisiibacteriota bacterium]
MGEVDNPNFHDHDDIIDFVTDAGNDYTDTLEGIAEDVADSADLGTMVGATVQMTMAETEKEVEVGTASNEIKQENTVGKKIGQKG